MGLILVPPTGAFVFCVVGTCVFFYDRSLSDCCIEMEVRHQMVDIDVLHPQRSAAKTQHRLPQPTTPRPPFTCQQTSTNKKQPTTNFFCIYNIVPRKITTICAKKRPRCISSEFSFDFCI